MMDRQKIIEKLRSETEVKCCFCNKKKEEMRPYMLSYLCKDCETRINRAYDNFYD